MTDRHQRMDLTATVDFGTAELVADPRHPGGWTLLVNDVAQSYVDLEDPTRLEMMYARLVAGVVDAVLPEGRAVDVLHLGAGGLTLPRHLAASRPGSRQLVIEVDRGLAEFVQYGLPVPPDSGIRLRLADAADAIREHAPDSTDLVISDVYRGGDMPTAVSGTGFAQYARRALRPGGLFVLNALDAAGLLATRRHAATVTAVFDHVAVVATPQMLRGRRDGNTLVVAADRPLPEHAIVAASGRHGATARVLTGEALARFIGGTSPLQG
ncbi:spermidine synthase [Stackebrandtia albiflava]|uniref:Spermidine synthase n=1 Tax=Stackebrandtia albiflava TaxID=406432 RepID=A0A562VEQ6_9ACTN|nr:fused MFS/spermidine synthase [Stackebrandtia albiflava]TWJ16362.1 spermidine synthase [Stackebrandtia albiflava]